MSAYFSDVSRPVTQTISPGPTMDALTPNTTAVRPLLIAWIYSLSHRVLFLRHSTFKVSSEEYRLFHHKISQLYIVRVGHCIVSAALSLLRNGLCPHTPRIPFISFSDRIRLRPVLLDSVCSSLSSNFALLYRAIQS